MKNQLLITVVKLSGILLVVFGGLYLWFINIDFVGKTQEQVDASRKFLEARMLRAEYRNGTDHRFIQLTDKVTAEFMAGNSKHDLGVWKTYTYKNDTISFLDSYPDKGIEPELFEFLNAKKFVVKDSLLFMLDSHNVADTLRPLKIKFNKLD
jgi:hypothetical protein